MLGYDLWSMAQQADKIDGSELGSKYPEISRDELNMGIIPRSMMNIFEQMEDERNGHIEYHIFVSYIEIYNEKIKDLLTFDPDSDLSLEIRESKRGEISVTNLVEVEVQNVAQVFEVLWSGAQARCIATTDMNDYSSRSHTIFQVRMTQTSVSGVSGNSTTKRGKLCFIDLAGSEKWKSHQLSQFSQERIKELTSINKSLSALGNCISALLRDKGKHVPYRDSKLTRLLQDSLGGNTKTLFIVTLSPSVSCLDETTSTLQFADRAMKVQIFAAPNITENVGANSGDSELVAERYRQEILNLKAIIQSLLHKEKTGASDGRCATLEAPQAINETLWRPPWLRS
jgi:kinesin family protein 3/17